MRTVVVTRTVTYTQVVEVEGITDIDEAIDTAIDIVNPDSDDWEITYENYDGYLEN